MKKFIACLVMSTVLFTGCTFMHKTQGIIKVNDQTITQADFDEAFEKGIDQTFLKQFGGAKNLKDPASNPLFAVFKDKIVRELIIKSLLEQEMDKRGIKASKEDVQNELKTVIDKVGSKEELNKILKQRGISNDQLNRDLETQVKIRKLVNSIEKVNITDADVQKYYNTHKDEFKHPEQVRASHILVMANTVDLIKQIKEKNPNINPTDLNAEVEKQMETKKAQAEAILAEVNKNPADFAKIAQAKSEDKGSAPRGGELGFFPKEAMVKEFAEAAFSMAPNTISKSLVKTDYGYHIIMVTDRREAGVTPLAKVKDEVKFYLETQKQIYILKKLTDSLMKNANIEYLNDEYNPEKIKKEEIKKPVKK